jgi:hypothetical protein
MSAVQTTPVGSTSSLLISRCDVRCVVGLGSADSIFAAATALRERRKSKQALKLIADLLRNHPRTEPTIYASV